MREQSQTIQTLMTEEVKNVHREPHPFVSTQHMHNFVGRTVAFVGKVSSVDDGSLNMLTHQGDEVKVLRYKNEIGLSAGQMVEIRGIVNKDKTISFGEHTPYDAEFDLQIYEQMLEYYHGMCKELSVK